MFDMTNSLLRRGVTVLLVILAFIYAVPVSDHCHDDDKDHGPCAAANATSCCTTHSPALSQASASLIARDSRVIAHVTGDDVDTGVLSGSSPFQPPRV